MKKLWISFAFVVILLTFSVSGFAGNTSANNSAKKGLIVDEAGMYRYSSYSHEWGPKIEPRYAKLGDITDSYYDRVYSRLRLKNRQDYSIGVRVSCEVYFNGRYQNTYSWEYTEIPARTGAHEFWLEEFDRYDSSFTPGKYEYSWYIDGNWLIDREFNISK
ncbi:MAG: hypothetical protein IJ719_11145 [Clostridia bacterium]|nr:hypothetical protein [Clostridia bacterium]